MIDWKKLLQIQYRKTIETKHLLLGLDLNLNQIVLGFLYEGGTLEFYLGPFNLWMSFR